MPLTSGIAAFAMTPRLRETGPGGQGGGGGFPLPLTGYVVDVTAAIIFSLLVLFLIVLIVRELKLRNARPWPQLDGRGPADEFDQLRMFGDRAYRWPTMEAVGSPDPFGIHEFVAIIGQQILKAEETSLAVAIDAEWGMGKSSAMWMLRQWLEKHGCLAIWFNAWKYRRTDMQRAFISAVISGIPAGTWGQYLSPRSKRLKLIQQTGDLIGRATRMGQIGSLIASAFGDETYYRNQLEDDFREVIKTWARQGPARHELVVIFVDDLDRCQPAEVARVLEAMKLFFETPGCIFVFGYDSLQVAESIKKDNQGIVSDGLIYLKKLIQFTFQLPRPRPEALRAFLDANIADRRLAPLFAHLRDETDYHALILQGTGGNLRDVKRFLDALVVSAQVIRQQLADAPSYLALCLLVMLQVRWPRCQRDLERATRMEALRPFIGDIYWYLEREAKRAEQRAKWQRDVHETAQTSSPGSASAAHSEHAHERDTYIKRRMPWLIVNDDLQAFLRRYQLRGLEDDIQRLILNGLPRVDGGMPDEDEEGAIESHFALLPDVPVAPGQFVGRSVEVERLMEILKSRGHGGVVPITGLGGIGKTTLAVVAAERLRTEGLYKDGIAWVVGAGRSDPVEVLRDALGQFVSREYLPEAATVESLAALAAQWLRDKDVLIVIDGVEPALPIRQVAAALQGAGATLLLTARQPLDVPSAETLELAGLVEPEALELFYRYLNRVPTTLSQSDRQAARHIVTALAFNPLLIHLTAEYVVQTRQPLDVVQAAIERSGATDVTAVIQRSLGLLPQDAQRLFAALATFAAPEFGQRAVVALGITLGIEQVESRIEQLVATGLLESAPATAMPAMSDRQRVALHPLVREYALGMLQRGTEHEREEARTALTAYYARYSSDMAALAPEALDPDMANIQAALEWALERNEDAQIAGIAAGLGVLWNARGNTEESLRMLPQALAAAGRVAVQSAHREDQLRAADIALAYAQALRRDGQTAQAQAMLDANLATRRTLVDRRGEGRVLAQLGLMARLAGKMDAAAEFLEQSLKIRQEEGDRAGEAYDLSQLGQMAKTRGRLDEAERYFTQSLELRRKAGDRAGEADDLGYRGEVARLRGETDIAEGFYRESLEKARVARYPRAEATAHSHLGQLERVRGNLDRAQEHLEESLKIRRQTRDKRREGFDLGLLGRIEQARGRLDSAEQLFQESLQIARLVQDTRGIAAVLSSLAQLDLARGNLAGAENSLRECLPLHRSIQDVQGESIALSQLGRLCLDRGDFEQATHYFQQSLEIERASKDRPGEGVDLSQLALVAIEAGHLDEAARYLEESVPIRQQVRDARGEGVDVSLLGRIAFERGQLQEAEALYQRSLDLARQVQNRRGEGVNIRYLGLITEQRGNLDQAERSLRDSLEIGEEVHNGLDIADAKREMGRFLIERRGQRDAGCVLMTEAVRSYQEIGARRQEQQAHALATSLGCTV